MSSINGQQADFSFTRDGNTLQVVSNATGNVVKELTNDLTVVFNDGTVNLAQTIDNVTAESSSVSFGSPSSTVLKEGGYVLTWEYYNQDDSEDGILLQQYDASGALVMQTKLASYEAEDPSVTAKSDGGYIVAWSASTESTSSILVQQYTAAGVATAKAQTVATSSSVELDDAVVAMLPNGKFVVTWSAITEDESNGWTETGDLFSQLFNATGTKVGSAQKINGATVEGTVAEDQSVLPTADGFLVAYVKEWSTTQANVPVYHSALEVRSFNASGVPTGEPKLVTSLDAVNQNASYPSLLVTDDGYVLTWSALVTDGSGRTLMGQQLDANLDPVGAEKMLTPSSGTAANANDASLTQLSNGQYVAVWTTFVAGPGYSVYAQVYTDGLAKVGDLILVKSDANSHEPNVTALHDGEFLVSWASNSYTIQSVEAEMLSQRYDASGNLIGNTTTVISGDASANTLTWAGAGDVTLQGYNGNDTLTGGAGNDILDGGNGNDTVIASGVLADSSFSLHNGNVVITGPNGTGQDTLISIENVTFDDATITLSDGTTDLESDAQTVGEEVATAALNDGSQVAVWKQNGEVVVQLYRDGHWQQADATGIQYGYGTLAVSALDDGFIISWGEDDDGVINAQRFDADGEEVGAPIAQAAIDPAREIDDISVTQLKDGGFVLAWTEKTPEQLIDGDYTDSVGNAYFQVYDAQGTASTPVALATGAISAFEPSVSALQNGGFVAVWEYVNDAKESEEIYIQRFKADGSPDGKASQVNTGTKGDQGDPEVTTLADGSYVVVWTRETDDDRKYTDQFGNQHVEEITTSIDIFMQRYTADGKKAGAESQVNTGTGFHNDPVITSLKGGGYVVAWATSDERDVYSGDSSLYAQVFDKNGVKVGDQVVVATSDDEDYFPSISASDDGGFLVTWEAGERDDSSARDVYAKQYDANGNSVTLTGDTGDNTLTWSGANGITLNGGDGDDVLTGGAGNDTLLGGDGMDTLDGQGGNNVLIGGDGDDTYVVHSARDVIVETEEGGYDVVQSSVSWTLGDNLEQLILTGSAAITGTGNALGNRIVGNDGANTIYGGEGHDWMDGGAGVDKLFGGTGDDTYLVDLVVKGAGAKATVALQDIVTEKAGEGDRDILGLRLSPEEVAKLANATTTTTLTLGANLEEFDATLTDGLKLNLTGNALNNTLIGNDSDNVLNGGAGIDAMVGMAGDDTYVIDSLDELALVNTWDGFIADDDGNDTLRLTLKGGTTLDPRTIDVLGLVNLAQVENVQITGTGVFNLTGNDLDNRLEAGKATGSLAGGLGDDVYVLTNKAMQVIENDGEGTDTLEASFTADLATYANVENLTLTGKAAINATGNSGINVLTGNDGANVLDGGAGADTLMGGKGNDTYIVDDANDVVVENAKEGTDTIKASVNFDLNDALEVENLTLTGSALNATGNDAANTLTGNSGANRLDGGAGVDKLIGGIGNDTYVVDLFAKGTGLKVTAALEDTITEKKGEGDHDNLVLRVSDEVLNKLNAATKATTLTLANYLEDVDASGTGELKINLTGNAADNTIIGSDAGNTLNGGAGNDVIIGCDGADLIIGGVGADTMTGGLGRDTFSFTSLKDLGKEDGQDEITDFVSGTDQLDFKALKGWSFNGMGADNHATGAKQLWAVAEDGGTTIYGNSGGSNAADFSIKLSGVTHVTSDDFVLA